MTRYFDLSEQKKVVSRDAEIANENYWRWARNKKQFRYFQKLQKNVVFTSCQYDITNFSARSVSCWYPHSSPKSQLNVAAYIYQLSFIALEKNRGFFTPTPKIIMFPVNYYYFTYKLLSFRDENKFFKRFFLVQKRDVVWKGGYNSSVLFFNIQTLYYFSMKGM